jgi:ribonuclease J
MPLVGKNETSFDFNKFKTLNIGELINQGILPDIEGLYDDSIKHIDGVIISHSHQDHYGLSNYIHKNIKFYLGEATHKIIEINNMFTPQDLIISNATYFQREIAFQIGDISITPYWADHSAFDAYSFLLEANGKSIFYSGDLRNHGRKSNVFKWFTHNAPQNVDYLLLEGTTIGRESKPFKTEKEIEADLTEVFKQEGKINLIYTSGQNIDRIVSIYRACIKAGKILVVDVYVASILKGLSKFAKIPFPSKDFKNVKVIFSFYTSRRLKNKGHEQILYNFKYFKITKEEISNQADKIVMLIRPSMQKDLDNINGIDGGNLIYSMWEGYLEKPDTIKFIDYLTSRKLALHKIHTSEHADTQTLIKMVEAIKPKNIVTIFTFSGIEYKNIFSPRVIELNDGETLQI